MSSTVFAQQTHSATHRPEKCSPACSMDIKLVASLTSTECNVHPFPNGMHDTTFIPTIIIQLPSLLPPSLKNSNVHQSNMFCLYGWHHITSVCSAVKYLRWHSHFLENEGNVHKKHRKSHPLRAKSPPSYVRTKRAEEVGTTENPRPQRSENYSSDNTSLLILRRST